MAFWVIEIASSVDEEGTIYTFFFFEFKMNRTIYAIVPETNVM
jgi:hypothetical protein